MSECFGLSTSLLSYIEAVLCGILEVTNGISMVTSLGTSVFTICLTSFLLRFWRLVDIHASSKHYI